MASYCKEDNCARVVYQEYLPAVVRWRYPGEGWQEIEGDDHLFKQFKGQSNTVYYIGGVAAKNGINYCETPNLTNNWGFPVHGPVHGLAAKFVRTDDRYSCPNYTSIVGKANVYLAYISFGNNKDDNRYSIIYFYEPHKIDDVVKINYFVRADGQEDQTSCEFKIFKNGQTAYTETRDVCPEVEKLPPRLSDIHKETKINKTNTEAVEINADLIPSNCLNIYLKSADALDFKAQICSASNCPAPEYQVVCGCDDRESCPANTCVVKCGSKVCCYGSDGISVKSIELSSYGG